TRGRSCKSEDSKTELEQWVVVLVGPSLQSVSFPAVRVRHLRYYRTLFRWHRIITTSPSTYSGRLCRYQSPGNNSTGVPRPGNKREALGDRDAHLRLHPVPFRGQRQAPRYSASDELLKPQFRSLSPAKARKHR